MRVAALLSSVLLVAACGGSSDSSGPPASGTTPSGGGSTATGGSSGAGGGTSAGGASGGTSAGGAGGGGSSTPPDFAMLANQYATALCALFTKCEGLVVSSVYFGGEDCATRLARQIQDGDFAAMPDLFAAGKLSYDASQVQGCLDAISNASCDQLDARTPDACKAVIAGTAAMGDACTVDAECTAGLFCDGRTTGCPGKCSPLGQAGDACVRNEGCTSGLDCDKTTGTCRQPAAEGQACGLQGQAACASGLFCAGVDQKNMTPGTCKKPSDVFVAALGASCDLKTPTFCQAGASCAVQSVSMGMATLQCVAPASSGGACQIAFPDMCPTGETCNADISKGQLSGTCVPLPKAGEPCASTTSGRKCEPYAVCDNGTCTALQSIGGACTSGVDCYGGNCQNATCAAGPACSAH